MVLTEEEVLNKLFTPEEISVIKKEGSRLAEDGKWEAKFEQKAHARLDKLPTDKEVKSINMTAPGRVQLDKNKYLRYN